MIWLVHIWDPMKNGSSAFSIKNKESRNGRVPFHDGKDKVFKFFGCIMHHTYKAMLVMGPTGAGKTPLGDLCEKTGINGTPCVHFDFGENLRQAASRAFPDILLSFREVAFIKTVLHSGALLENETFFIAEKIFKAFIAEKKPGKEDCILLNGLPRHLDQAKDTYAMVDIQTVILLECTPEVVFERIRLNSGGDRTHREDDRLDKIKDKLDIYRKRTLPLLDYFSSRRIPVKTIHVRPQTLAGDILNQI
jgi:adenylate kinase family enzyme